MHCQKLRWPVSFWDCGAIRMWQMIRRWNCMSGKQTGLSAVLRKLKLLCRKNTVTCRQPHCIILMMQRELRNYRRRRLRIFRGKWRMKIAHGYWSEWEEMIRLRASGIWLRHFIWCRRKYHRCAWLLWETAPLSRQRAWYPSFNWSRRFISRESGRIPISIWLLLRCFCCLPIRRAFQMFW